ncbi:serine hydrolase domain-containing protein [Nakamurella sp.]|uniref:serine hydrolase domain-containing protein n=1 Tax=Nakamurella sp. TaxID=1869182 RepID=UPI003B3B2D55
MNRNRLTAAVLAVGLIGLAGCTSSTSSSTSSSGGASASTSAAASSTGGSGAAAPGSAGTSTGAEPAYVAAVSASVAKTMKDNVIPGAVVLISSRDQGEWTGTFGTRTWGTDEPMQAGDHFRIGSNTKTMTSTVILQLVQEGKLALDDPIAKYIPGVPGGDGITIANLSEMRSGLYSYSFDPTFNNTLDQEPQKVWTPQELLDIAFSHPQNGPPGQEFNYSNTNIILLGMVIEKLTGMTAEQAFQERIFTPLGLKDTSLPLDSAIPNPHPQGYSFGSNTSTIDTYALPAELQPLALDGRLLPNNETMANPSWAWTAGGAISTVQDMKTYVEAMVDGGLLDPATQKIRMDSVEGSGAGSTAGYGLGIAKFDKLYGHDGQIPGFMTFMGHDPESGLTIVIATNLATIPNGEGSALAILKGLIPIFYPNAVIPGDPAAAPGATGSGPAPTSGG